MSAKLASLGLFKGRYGVNQPKEANKASGREEKKETDRQEEEITSSVVGHRLQLLDKALRLLAIQSTTSVDEELELLLVGLSI